MFYNRINIHPTAVMALTPGKNSDRNFIWICGGKKELHMRWRFFENFEKGIERGITEHMHFINDINLIRTVCGHVVGVFAKLADIFNFVVGCAVNFKHICGMAGGDFTA